MKYNPAKHHRRSIRLRGFDYSSAGAYFVTAVLHHRVRWFGSVNETGMQMSGAGRIAWQCWKEMPLHFPYVALDEFVIMPDHFHGIVIIKEDDNSGGVQLNAATMGPLLNAATMGSPLLNTPSLGSPLLNTATMGRPLFKALALSNRLKRPAALNIPPTRKEDNYFSFISPRKRTLGVIIRTYKAAVTTLCRKNGFPGFNWQRDYYEHIIRNEHELRAIRKYIANNPAHWHDTHAAGV